LLTSALLIAIFIFKSGETIMSLYKTLTKGKQLRLSAFSIAILAMSVSQMALAGFNDSIKNALKFGQADAKYGQIKFDTRLRYDYANTEETVNKKTAEAFTARLRVGYLSPKFKGLQGYAEFEGNQDIGLNDYRNKRNDGWRKNGYDVIQDPQDTELNQLWLSFDGIPDTNVKVGRQRIKIDNDRFIGNVGWRQMEQTFDSVLLTNKSLPNTTVKVGYIDQVKNIISTTDEMTTPFLNIAYDFKGYGKLSAYGYWIDYDELAKSANSSQTYGLRFNGGTEVTEDVKALYTAEYAHQSDYGDNTTGYDVDYFHFTGGISAFGVTAKGGVEQLGGQNNKVFSTPLATGHAFQGWADAFLVAQPGSGIRDVYGSIATKIKGVKIMGIYHDFEDDSGSIEHGNEYDFVVATKIAKHYSLLAKYAYYNADQFGNDTQKIWIQGGIHF